MQILRPLEAMMDQHQSAVGSSSVNIEPTRSGDGSTLEECKRCKKVQILRLLEAMMDQYQSVVGASSANIEATRSDDRSTLEECCGLRVPQVVPQGRRLRYLHDKQSACGCCEDCC